MIKVVSWNIGKREKPWRQLVQMAREGDADLALLQEAGRYCQIELVTDRMVQ